MMYPCMNFYVIIAYSKYDKDWQPYIKEKPFALFAAAKAASDAVKYIEEYMLTKEQRNDKFLRAEDVRNNPNLLNEMRTAKNYRRTSIEAYMKTQWLLINRKSKNPLLNRS